jgi:hypothetical protein
LSSDREGLNAAEERLSRIRREMERIAREAQTRSDGLVARLGTVVEEAETVRKMRVDWEDLKAEALYLRLLHQLPPEEAESPRTDWKRCEAAWREFRASMQPVRPSAEWLEKIREVEESRTSRPVLTPEERSELERRLKDNVCPICVSFALDGSCTLEAFDTCPIDLYLNRLVVMIEQLGHRPWMEDYFERMFRDICPGCRGRVDQNYCPPREEGDCSLYAYLPSVVRTVEDFLRERAETQQR